MVVRPKAQSIKRTKATDLKDQYTKVTKLGLKDDHTKKVEAFKMKRFEKVESIVKG